jgi:hypothetical protein
MEQQVTMTLNWAEVGSATNDSIVSAFAFEPSNDANPYGPWVPVTRKVNGYQLINDINITAQDIGAMSDGANVDGGTF